MICITCDHDCHCGDSCNALPTDGGCGCRICEHKEEDNMIKKIANKVMHYWTDHKTETLVFIALVAVIIYK